MAYLVLYKLFFQVLSRFFGTQKPILIYSHSTKPKQFRIGHIACHIHGTFDYLNYPYYPAYTG